MTFVITQPCIDVQDQSCVEVCPVDCIHFAEGADRMLYIEPDVCIDCGACEPVCPVTAIFTEEDVPKDQARFTEINALWFTDPAAARAQVGGEPAGAAPAAEDAPAAEEAAAETPAEAAAEEAAPAAAAAVEPAAAAVAAGSQVEAIEEHAAQGGVVVSQYRLPSPVNVVAITGLMISLAAVWLAPGDNLGLPDWDIFGDLEGPSKLGLAALVPAVLFLGLFIKAQAHDMRRFDAKRVRSTAAWREAGTPWRRSEESRRYELETTIGQLARDRFPFPDEQHPEYRTYVNVPEPQIALEFTAGGASRAQVFPDIVVVEHPRNRPIMVAQVETRETVTRRQAELVWAQLESDDAPLYLYVPSGLAARARDYALAAGVEHVQVRTWRRQPGGMFVEEV